MDRFLGGMYDVVWLKFPPNIEIYSVSMDLNVFLRYVKYGILFHKRFFCVDWVIL